jgi:hypothetical protein
MQHAENPYFNQEGETVIDTTKYDIRCAIRDDTRLFPLDFDTSLALVNLKTIMKDNLKTIIKDNQKNNNSKDIQKNNNSKDIQKNNNSKDIQKNNNSKDIQKNNNSKDIQNTDEKNKSEEDELLNNDEIINTENSSLYTEENNKPTTPIHKNKININDIRPLIKLLDDGTEVEINSITENMINMSTNKYNNLNMLMQTLVSESDNENIITTINKNKNKYYN